MKNINRNLRKEIITDIDFINGIITYIKEGDNESAITCLNDWKHELVELCNKKKG